MEPVSGLLASVRSSWARPTSSAACAMVGALPGTNSRAPRRLAAALAGSVAKERKVLAAMRCCPACVRGSSNALPADSVAAAPRPTRLAAGAARAPRPMLPRVSPVLSLGASAPVAAPIMAPPRMVAAPGIIAVGANNATFPPMFPHLPAVVFIKGSSRRRLSAMSSRVTRGSQLPLRRTGTS
jgi:hypothetical protein